MSAGAKPITIAGGGLAGLTLGIALRQKNVPVTLFEAGHYPRHRVCGEFASGRGLQTLARLGLRDRLMAAGGHMARTAAFFTAVNSGPTRKLPEPALCCSRYVLDDFLAQEFSRSGGDMRTNARWTGDWNEGLVRATGRRIQTVDEGWRLFGLKAHARNVLTRADLEMHLRPDGYVGICRLDEERVNVCGLFRSRTAVTELRDHWMDWLRGEAGSPIHERLANAEFEAGSFCSVAGFSLQTRAEESIDECALGDAMGMIPPVTGNGMSIAFESAELAAEPLADYSRGEMGWAETTRQIHERCAQAFGRRLKWGLRLHRWLLEPGLVEPMVFLTSQFQLFWRTSFALTR